MSDKIFPDSNVLVHAISKDDIVKSKVARELTVSSFLCSPQIIFEYMNVCRRKLRFSKDESIELAYDLLRIAKVIPEDEEVVRKSLTLLKIFDFSFFDSKIVATALLSGCSILYSENLHPGLTVENKLRIINPFITELNK